MARYKQISGKLRKYFLAALISLAIAGSAIGGATREPRASTTTGGKDADIKKDTKKGFVWGAILPHGPDILLEVTKDPLLMAKTRHAMEEAGRRFTAARVDTVILIDPLLTHTQNSFEKKLLFKGDGTLPVGVAARAGGRMGGVKESFECDGALAQMILDAGRGRIPSHERGGQRRRATVGRRRLDSLVVHRSTAAVATAEAGRDSAQSGGAARGTYAFRQAAGRSRRKIWQACCDHRLGGSGSHS